MPAIIVFGAILSEIIVSSVYISYLGFWIFLSQTILTVFLGVVIFLTTQEHVLDLVTSFSRQEIDAKEILTSTISRSFGALLMILPGALSDIIGLLLFFGVFTPLRQKRQKPKDTRNDDDIIEGEII